MDKRRMLNILLEHATKNFFEAKYLQAICLYEKALRLINSDPLFEENNLTNINICAIEYSLCRCYVTREEYFQKASDIFIPIVVLHGNKFPALYYGLAKLCFVQRCFLQTESIIKNCLKALSVVKGKTSFKANWPGTNVQIPESDCNVLITLLESLKTECIVTRTMECSDIYESDEFESDGTIIDDVVENVYPVERHSDNQSTSKSCEQQNFTLEKVKKHGQVLNADVPEFIPRSLKRDVNNSPVISNSLLNSTLETNMSSTTENKEPSEINKNTAQSSEYQAEGCHKMMEESLQTKITSSNVFTQTPEQVQEISECKQQIEAKDPCFRTCMTLVMEENKKLQEKVENLNKENKQNTIALDEYKKHFMQDQQKILVLENSAHIASIKSEAHIESLQSKIDQLEAEVEALKNSTDSLKKKGQIMQSIITTQSLQYFNLQERVLTEYSNNCRKMVFDLTNVLSYVSATSIPTAADCHCHIKEWQEHLEKAELYLALLKTTYQQVTKDISLGNFTKISNLPEYYIKLVQRNDILHDSFIPAVNTLYKENWVYYQQNVRFQQQQSQWWKACGQVNHPRPAIIAAAPQYYNIQEGDSAVEISDVTARSTSKDSVVIFSPSITSNSRIANSSEPENTSISKCVTDNLKSSQLLTKPASSTLNGSKLAVVMTFPNSKFKSASDNHGAPKTPGIVESSTTDATVETGHWWQSPNECNKSETSALNNMFPIDISETIQKYDKKVNDLFCMHLNSNAAKENARSSASKETSDKVNNAKINTTGSSNTSNVEPTLTAGYANLSIDKKSNISEVKPPINPFSFACTKNVLQSSTLKKEAQETRSNDASRIYTLPTTSANHSLKQISSSDNASSFIIQDNSGNNSTVAFNVDNSEQQNNNFKQEEQNRDKVYYFQGISNNSESKNKQLFSFALTKDCEDTILSNTDTVNDNDHTVASACQLTREISTTPKEVPLSVDYSHLPEAVKKAGRSFCDLYLYVIERVPEKNESEIFAALKKVRRKNTKLSGMSKNTIVAAVRTELKIDQKNDGYMDKSASASAIIESEAMELNKNKQIVCAICFEPFGAIPLAKLPCGHAFHKKCVRQWFIYKSDCPVCRIFVIY